MPELPEVETICRRLQPHLEGDDIERQSDGEAPTLPGGPKVRQCLEGKTIFRSDELQVHLISLSNDIVWVVHLGCQEAVHVDPDTETKA
jgi:formamidopyrimidine-DNA glycosylase